MVGQIKKVASVEGIFYRGLAIIPFLAKFLTNIDNHSVLSIAHEDFAHIHLFLDV
jgi:ABC-type Zn uptake system ZnuABC Zn-binding protein ZnuA